MVCSCAAQTLIHQIRDHQHPIRAPHLLRILLHQIAQYDRRLNVHRYEQRAVEQLPAAQLPVQPIECAIRVRLTIVNGCKQKLPPGIQHPDGVAPGAQTDGIDAQARASGQTDSASNLVQQALQIPAHQPVHMDGDVLKAVNLLHFQATVPPASPHDASVACAHIDREHSLLHHPLTLRPTGNTHPDPEIRACPRSKF